MCFDQTRLIQYGSPNIVNVVAKPARTPWKIFGFNILQLQ